MKMKWTLLTLLTVTLIGLTACDMPWDSDNDYPGEEEQANGGSANVDVKDSPGATVNVNVVPAAPTPTATPVPVAGASMGLIGLIGLMLLVSPGCVVIAKRDYVMNMSPSASAGLLTWKSGISATAAQDSADTASRADPDNEGGGSLQAEASGIPAP